MQRIASIDAMFLDVERPRTPSVIAGFFVLDPSTAPEGVVRHRGILKYVEDRLHLSPSLRRRLVFNPLLLDEPRLIDDENFDLEFHVRHLGLPQPRDRRQLSILAARLFSRPMDLDRPLWEMYVIEGLENIPEYPRDAFAILFKLHHAAFDGIAAAATVFSLLQRDPLEVLPPASRQWVPERPPRLVEWAVDTWTQAAKQSLQNVRALPGLVRGGMAGAVKSIDGAPGDRLRAPVTRFQRKVSSHRIFDWVTFSTAEIAVMRAKLGKPKMNDFALCLVAGALRRYLQLKEELPTRSLIAACPINTRGAGSPMEGGNHVAMMRVRLGTEIADPVERLRAISAGSAKGKSWTESWGPKFFGDFLSWIPYIVRSTAVKQMRSLVDRGKLAPMANTTVTNVPNPRGQFFFAGSRLMTYAGLGPVYDGYGLFHTVTSTEWELSISATSCRETLPDIAVYMSGLSAEYDELKRICEALPEPLSVTEPVAEAKRNGSTKTRKAGKKKLVNGVARATKRAGRRPRAAETTGSPGLRSVADEKRPH